MNLVGRANELATIAASITAVDVGSNVLVIDAEAGAGKSAVLDAAVTAAQAEGVRVLRCRPTVTESQLAYAALGDLLETVRDLRSLDAVPRGALERALLRGAPDASVEIEPRSVGMACAAVWRELSAASPVLVVIDDLHWLDAPSAEALAFSFRRLPPTGVAVVCARRTNEPVVTIVGDVLELPPLPQDSLTTLLVERSRRRDRRLSARQLRAVVDASGGNPLFALELTREAEQRPQRDDELVPVPRSLDELIDRRFGDVAADVNEALAAVALVARPDLATIRRLDIVEAIERAERDGLVDTATGRVVFTHPLFAASILCRTQPSARRRLHRRLAEVTDGTESVRHAGLAAEGPDRSLSDRLAALADDLVSRGALGQAADFAVLAATLCPDDDACRPERYVAAAQLSFQRGETNTCVRMLAEVDRSASTASVRVRELMVRARVAFSTSSSSSAAAAAREALQHCTTDVERIEVHSTLSRVAYDHFPTAADHARIALDLAEHTEVPTAVLASVLTGVAGTQFMSGGGLDRELWRRAIELERELPVYVGDSAIAGFAALLKVADELDEARTMLLQILADNADDGALPFALSHLPQLELWTGNWDLAEEYAARHLDAALTSGQHDQVAQAKGNLAQISIYRGDVDDARELATELVEHGRAAGDPWTERSGVGQLGLIAMAEGDAETAVTHLTRWVELGETMGLREPGYCRLRPDYVEALVATGRLEAAADFAEMMQREAERFDRPTLLSTACRVRALVAAANGDREGAVALAREAVDRGATTPLVVDHARALLTLGQIHRRFKEKSAARAALQEALAIFGHLGAEGFAERARQDLARIGLRPPTSTGLTETERRVAELAAVGRTVRQIGDELFISPKTVEANLTRVYRKLAVSGRTELAAALAAEAGDRARQQVPPLGGQIRNS